MPSDHNLVPVDQRSSDHPAARREQQHDDLGDLIGLAGLTRNSAYAHRWDRIRINGLNIGWTESEGESQTQRSFHQADDDWASEAAKKVPMGKLGQPDEIAEMVVLLLSPRSGVVTGSVIDWDQIVIGGHD